MSDCVPDLNKRSIAVFGVDVAKQQVSPCYSAQAKTRDFDMRAIKICVYISTRTCVYATNRYGSMRVLVMETAMIATDEERADIVEANLWKYPITPRVVTKP
jgi:hypothetical protein